MRGIDHQLQDPEIDLQNVLEEVRIRILAGKLED